MLRPAEPKEHDKLHEGEGVQGRIFHRRDYEYEDASHPCWNQGAVMQCQGEDGYGRLGPVRGGVLFECCLWFVRGPTDPISRSVRLYVAPQTQSVFHSVSPRILL